MLLTLAIFQYKIYDFNIFNRILHRKQFKWYVFNTESLEVHLNPNRSSKALQLKSLTLSVRFSIVYVPALLLTTSLEKDDNT